MTDTARPTYTFLSDCPARLAVDLVGRTWSLVVLHGLRPGPTRPRDLRARIGGISPKVLNQRLRRLRQSGLVERREYAEAPPRVDYTLTGLGHSLLEAFEPLALWADDNAEAVLDAQDRFPDT